jgi:F-type H+-transporting ATPase subunit delta
MRINLLAKRYAKALFDLSLDMKVQEQIQNDVLLIKSVLDENRGLRKILSNPVINGDKKVKLLNDLFGKYVAELTLKFFILIVKKDREMYLEGICDAFMNLYRDHYNILPVTFTTAFKTENSIHKEIVKMVEESTGKNVELGEDINEEIIGGFIISYGDYKYDASIKKQLKELRKNISTNV